MTWFFFFNKVFIEKCKENSTENPGFSAMWVPIQFGNFLYFIYFCLFFVFTVLTLFLIVRDIY